MPHKLLSVAAVAAVMAALAPAASADQEATPTPSIEGAYAYIDHMAAAKHDLVFVRVVFRTSSALPRRFDGMIRAGGAIDGTGQSLGTVRKGTTIYTAATVVKDGKFNTRTTARSSRRPPRPAERSRSPSPPAAARTSPRS